MNTKQAAYELLTKQMQELKNFNESIKLDPDTFLNPDNPDTQVRHILRQAYENLYEFRAQLVDRNPDARLIDDYVKD